VPCGAGKTFNQVIAVQVTAVNDFAALGRRWRDLESRSNGSFFQSWTWTGCLAQERFPDPILVEAISDGRTVALALFNRVRRRWGPPVLHLGESGNPELDCPYIEQNGVLAEAGREDELTALCLRAVASRFELVLSGIGEPVFAAARDTASLVLPGRSQESPYVDLAALRASGADYLSRRSANTRQQIRRSDRFYLQSGPIALQRAGSVVEAHRMLDRMANLHQATWTARGRPGSFARPFFKRFHQALIELALPRGEIDLIQVSCGETVVGILYNFTHAGRSLAYQSGFAYQPGASTAKPGLTCHARAIQDALDAGLDVYDFLAGEDRYKRSLSDRSHQQIWTRAGPLCAPSLMFRRAVEALRSGAPVRRVPG